VLDFCVCDAMALNLLLIILSVIVWLAVGTDCDANHTFRYVLL